MNLQKTRKNSSQIGNANNRITTVLFTIYLLAIGWILLFKLGVRFSYMEKRSVNLIPFSEPLILHADNILNVISFVPLGVYAGLIFAKWIFGKKLLFFLLVSLLIEALQYILRIGAFDVTDIITNISGGIIGLLLCIAIKKVFNSNSKAQKFINKVAAIATALMILLLVLLKLNMLPIRYQ